jgi:pimeloyl-ACP methyl ester carboxylesterase
MKHRFLDSPRAAALTALFVIGGCPLVGWSMSRDEAVGLCRNYLAADRASQRQRILKQLADYGGPVEAVIQRLTARTYKPVKPGLLPAEHFSADDLRSKHPEDLLYFLIPPDYHPDRSNGLIVFMHGGGASTPRRVAGAALSTPGQSPASSASGDLFSATGMITVGPSSPDKPSHRRWCLEEADDYITDTILECKARFNIDPDRVFLVGHSMGGFGAYHMALRMPDRFAAIIVHSGSWNYGYWPALRGTPMCVVNGVHDARPGVRNHTTDVDFGRLTDQLLTRDHLEHVFFEHNGAHGFPEGKKYVFAYLKKMQNARRDPYYDHIGLASPNGFRETYTYPVVNNRWLSLETSTTGTIDYDELIPHDINSFTTWRLEYKKVALGGASLDAVNRHDNSIEVRTQNVSRFTVWLHPRMVNVARPVMIVVNGKVGFQGRLNPSVATAMESYDRRQDWGLIYPMKVVIDLH